MPAEALKEPAQHVSFGNHLSACADAPLGVQIQPLARPVQGNLIVVSRTATQQKTATPVDCRHITAEMRWMLRPGQWCKTCGHVPMP